MTVIFEYEDYRSYLGAWIKEHSSLRGVKGKLANAAGISSSLLSQIFKGEKNLTFDQAFNLSEYMGLSDIESDFFRLLIELERAGGQSYRTKLKEKISSTRKQAKRVSNQLSNFKELSREDKAQFYSSWIYTGVRNLVALPHVNNVNKISEILCVEPVIVQKTVKFLLERNLLKETKGSLSYNVAKTHVPDDSPFVCQHHKNWRLKAIDATTRFNSNHFHFTSPMSLSREVYDETRIKLPSLIRSIMKKSNNSNSEIVACLNVDWFKYGGK